MLRSSHAVVEGQRSSDIANDIDVPMIWLDAWILAGEITAALIVGWRMRNRAEPVFPSRRRPVLHGSSPPGRSWSVRTVASTTASSRRAALCARSRRPSRGSRSALPDNPDRLRRAVALRPLIIIDYEPPAPIRTAAHDIARRAFEVHLLAVATRAIDPPVIHELGVIVGDEHMAHLSHERHAGLDKALESDGDVCVTSDGLPVILYEHALRVEHFNQRADLAGVESLDQRRDNAFGICREWVKTRTSGISCSCRLSRDAATTVWFGPQL